MFHQKIAEQVRSDFSTAGKKREQARLTDGPRLVMPGEGALRNAEVQRGTRRFELVAIAARRCSSFFAEAAVLVLVFGILDLFMLKGRIESGWVAGSLAISVLLLAASVATEFGARRWLGAQP